MILHLALPEDWEAALAAGIYTAATRGRTIADEGFLHACFDEAQAARVDALFYADIPELVCLELDEDALTHAGFEVRTEPGNPVAPDSELFPHVYGGPIPVELITSTPWLRFPARIRG